jgi:hypothetical protein
MLLLLFVVAKASSVIVANNIDVDVGGDAVDVATNALVHVVDVVAFLDVAIVVVAGGGGEFATHGFDVCLFLLLVLCC